MKQITAKEFRKISRKLVLSECRVLRARIVLEKAINAYRGAVFSHTEYHHSINHFSKKLLRSYGQDALKKGKDVINARHDL